MKNPNWTKQAAANATGLDAQPTMQNSATTMPVTEDELEALRFRGTPIRRTLSPIVPQPVPASHYTNGTHSPPGSHNDRIQAINEAVRQTSAWVAPLRQEISRVLVGQKNLVDRLLVG